LVLVEPRVLQEPTLTLTAVALRVRHNRYAQKRVLQEQQRALVPAALLQQVRQVLAPLNIAVVPAAHLLPMQAAAAAVQLAPMGSAPTAEQALQPRAAAAAAQAAALLAPQQLLVSEARGVIILQVAVAGLPVMVALEAPARVAAEAEAETTPIGAGPEEQAECGPLLIHGMVLRIPAQLRLQGLAAAVVDQDMTTSVVLAAHMAAAAALKEMIKTAVQAAGQRGW